MTVNEESGDLETGMGIGADPGTPVSSPLIPEP